MNKKYILLLFIYIAFYNTSFWYELITKTNKINSIETSCNWANVNKNLYLLWNSEDYLYLRDNFINRENDLLQISNIDTEINYFTSENGLISIENNIPIENNFIRASWVAPKNTPVRAIETLNKTFFHIPQNKSNNKVQFIYKIAYKEQIWFKNWTSPYDYYQISNINDSSANVNYKLLTNNQKRIWGNVKLHSNECITYNLQWCWDWIQNWSEECDWWPDCDTTCKKIVTPKGSCSSLTYARYNNDYTFTCSWSTTWSAKITNYRIYNTKTPTTYIQTNTTWIFNVPWITTDETYSCDVQVDGSWVTTPATNTSCIRNTNTTTFSCSNLTPKLDAVPSPIRQNLTSTATRTNDNIIIDKHVVFANSWAVNTITWNTLSAVHNNVEIWKNLYKAYIFDSIWNNASSSWCSFVVSDTSKIDCDNWKIDLPAWSELKSDTPWLCAVWAAVSNFTATPNGNITNYTWYCNWVWGRSCWWSSWWWGWSWSSRNCAYYANSTYNKQTLNSLITETDKKLLCTNSWALSKFETTVSWNTTNYTWSCNNHSWCYANYTKKSTDSSKSPTCWDWIKQSTEICDYKDTTKLNWLSWTYCSSKCDYNKDITLDCEPEWSAQTEITLWWKQETPWNNFFVQNTSSERSIDFNWWELCLESLNDNLELINPNNWTNKICSPMIKEIFLVWTKIYIPKWTFKTKSWSTDEKTRVWYLKLYINWEVANVPTEHTYKIYTIKIVRPSIQNFGWWASLLKNNVSDISTLWNSKNMVMSNIWSEVSNYANKNITWSQALNIQTSQNAKLNNLNTNKSTKVTSAPTNLPTTKYNWFDNVFISDKNVVISSTPKITDNTTYIIDWDLNINSNIDTDKSVLFVTRWWNITIWANVTKINAILISIKDWNNWKIISEESTEQLYIYWALYWDLDKLLSNRTYIKSDWDYVKVWTNVSFSSKVFSNPPPLLSKFLWDYMTAQRVAK